MVNTLFLPELREMLAQHNEVELREFCEALHPSRTADFMDGLTPDEAWQILKFADQEKAGEIFGFFEHSFQKDIIETQNRDEIAALIAELSSDDRVDILSDVDSEIKEDLLRRLPADDRRDIMRLSQYPEGTAGSMMATEFMKLSENLTIGDAIKEVGKQSEYFETIYYVYIVDDEGHLRGVVSARQLLAGLRSPQTKLADIMESALITVKTRDDQTEVVKKVARMDLLAIPVVDDENHIVGIITHDDVIDVVREEAQDDLVKSAAIEPLEDTYLNTSILTFSYKRGLWLLVLFLGSLMTATALQSYDRQLEAWAWLVPFIPMIISTGGNSGNQSATLIIAALVHGEVTVRDWFRVVTREIIMGILLGLKLGFVGYLIVVFLFPSVPGFPQVLVVPITLVMVILTGTVMGATLPLFFKRLGLDPALMSNPFVAGIVDILGILIYLTVAGLFLAPPELG
ncbi:MAG: magnesium transporter [Pirellulaceae bacterium]|nr:magnesium transporter [Pirellulaceae bacterium]